MSTKIELGLVLLVLAALSQAAFAQDVNYSVNITSDKTLGNYLVNETGFSLYYFMKDAPGNGTSTCYDQCATNWPPLYIENLTLPEGLNATDFTTIERTDGAKQTAFKGWPLYFYIKDKKAGDVLGQNVNKIWFIVNPEKFPPEPK